MGRYGLQTDQWARIAPLLPAKDGDVGVTAKDNKLEPDWFRFVHTHHA